MRTSKILAEIQQLDPIRDHQRIVYLNTCYAFPWDNTRALEFALFRTYAVPSISGLLAQTGEFAQRAQKRYDDTDLILNEMLEHGYDSERGRAALRRMNQMHGRFRIANADFLYVLSTFVFEPIRWNARFGWRRFTPTEITASFQYWREVGRRMNIQEIPDDYAAFEAFNRAYEQEHFRFTESNRTIAQATVELFLAMYVPGPLRRLATPFVLALLDEPLLNAFGLPHPAPWLRRLVAGSLRLRGWLIARLPERTRPVLRTHLRRPTYPQGYAIEQLGTHGPGPRD